MPNHVSRPFSANDDSGPMVGYSDVILGRDLLADESDIVGRFRIRREDDLFEPAGDGFAR